MFSEANIHVATVWQHWLYFKKKRDFIFISCFVHRRAWSNMWACDIIHGNLKMDFQEKVKRLGVLSQALAGCWGLGFFLPESLLHSSLCSQDSPGKLNFPSGPALLLDGSSSFCLLYGCLQYLTWDFFSLNVGWRYIFFLLCALCDGDFSVKDLESPAS